MSKVLMSGLPGTGFLGVVLAVMLLGSLLFVWIVLFVRQSLIYIVLVLALAFAWPVAVFPPMRDTAKKTVELLVALIVAKPIMMLAMSVGISALGGIGATAPPTEIDCQGASWAECFARDAEAANRNMQIEIGALDDGCRRVRVGGVHAVPDLEADADRRRCRRRPRRRLGSDAGVAAGDAVRLLRAGVDDPAVIGPRGPFRWQRRPAGRRRRAPGWWWPPRRRRRRRCTLGGGAGGVPVDHVRP